MESLWRDIRYGVRMLGRNPGFTAIAVVTLALGIGANTAIFSVIYSLMFRPLPVKDAGQLVSLAVIQGDSFPSQLSYPDYRDYSEMKEIFSGVIAHNLTLTQLSAEGGSPERALFTVVSGNYFEVLGLEAVVGRTFSPEEREQMGAGNVIVLSHGFWQRRFAGDPNVAGTPVKLSGKPFTIIGVAPESFHGTMGMLVTDGYIPLTAGDSLSPGFRKSLEDRSDNGYRVIARLQPGVSLEQARAAAAVQAKRLEQEYPDSNKGVRALVHPEPMARMEPSAIQYLPPIASVFMTLVGLVLLIACANVAGLLLARATARQKEIAIRAALGAGRLRIVRQLLTESILLSLLGAAGGLLVAQWATGVLSSIRMATFIPFRFDFSFNYVIFGFALLVAVGTGIVAGLVPALQASRIDLHEALKEGGRGSGAGSRQYARRLLVVAQVGVSLVLLICAGLFIRSMWNFSNKDLGFKQENRLLVSVSTGLAGYDEPRGRIFYRELLERVRSLPGVRSATTSDFVPIDVRNAGTNIFAEGRLAAPEEENRGVMFNTVNTDFFRTMGTPIVQGRPFTVDDTESSRGVAIVNEKMAETFWPGQNPIGRRISIKSPQGPWLEVVGVAKQGTYNLPGERPTRYLYLPLEQNYSGMQILQVHAQADPMALLPAVREKVRELDAEMSLFDIKTMETHIRHGKGAVLFQLSSGMVGAFGVIGLVLAAIGLYGVMAYSVSQRTHEIGIRMALGATPGNILGMVLRQGVVLTLVGVALGLLGAFALTRSFANLLVGVSATDPLTFSTITVLLVAVALVAAYVPARRATKVDPMVALRYE